MNVNGLRELDEMAAKLEATIHKLPRVKRDALLRDVERIRVQLTDRAFGGKLLPHFI